MHKSSLARSIRQQLVQKCEEIDRSIRRRTETTDALLHRTYKHRPPSGRERRILCTPDHLMNEVERDIKARVLFQGGLVISLHCSGRPNVRVPEAALSFLWLGEDPILLIECGKDLVQLPIDRTRKLLDEWGRKCTGERTPHPDVEWEMKKLSSLAESI